MNRVPLLILLGLTAAGPIRAQDSPGPWEHGDELLSTSSAGSWVHILPDVDRIMVWSLPKTPSSEALKALRALTEESFPLDSTVERFRDACSARYNPSVFDETIAWFRSPLGQKVAEAERSPAMRKESARRQVREQVRSQWVSNRRLLLLGRLDGNLSLGTRQGIFALTLLEDLMNSIQRSSPDEKRWSDSEIQSRVDHAATTLESMLRDSVLFDLRVKYRSLSNDELQQYNEFLETFSGRWYVEILRQGLEDAFLAGRERFVAGASAFSLPLRETLVP